jgi:rhodanese-related sulfurtransferase
VKVSQVGFVAPKPMSKSIASYAERDPDFAQNVIDKYGKAGKVIIACDIGGTLKTTTEVAHKKKDYEVKDPERAFGRESRSLKAVHELMTAGMSNILHLEGGIQQWRYQGFPMEP